MTDKELDEKFASIKNRVINELVGGTGCASEASPEVEFTDVDKNFGSTTHWMEKVRIKGRMNNDFAGVGQYNQLLHDNNGKIITQTSEPLEKAGF